MDFHHIHDFLLEAWRKHPTSAAARDRDGRWTYEELYINSINFANWLRRQNVAVGDRILIEASSRRETVAMIFGSSMAGTTAIPVSPTAGTWELAHIVADADAVLMIRENSLPAHDAATRSPQDVWREISQFPAEQPYPQISPSKNAPALLIYTSGSTSTPKAVRCGATQIVFAVLAIAGKLGYLKSDIVYCRLPLSFDYGLYQTFLAAHAAAEIVLDPGGIDGQPLQRIRQCGASVVPLVPAMAMELVRLSRNRPGCPSVRLFTNTGEAMTTELARALRCTFPHAAVQLMYGTTECKRISILEPDEDIVKPGSVGLPLPGTTVRILDEERRPAEPGKIGEIVVSGPHVMDGYWNCPEVTGTVFENDVATGVTVLHTGDDGYMDEDGYIYVLGRRDNVFKRRGIRTSTDEIEAAVRSLAGISDAAVVPPEDRRDAVLYVVLHDPGLDVLVKLRMIMDPRKIPGICRRVDSIPRSPNGKLDRGALRRLGGGQA
jgi:acyl-CoA synthetase (AMP-forming)/AMP-acid ligase II